MTSLSFPLDLSVPSSALPSPPTSPTSPATTRIRLKAPKRPGSSGDVLSTPDPKDHGERTRCTSQSLSRIVTADPDSFGSEGGTIALATTRAVPGKRRQPSITYYTPSSPSPWNQRSPLNRPPSSGVDGPRDGESFMANGKENVSRRSSLVLSSRSSARESMCSLDGVGAREREALTLVEKHADLLHFIAQKERKCLELRDQLASHEKELAELKRKWERIVNRGHDSFPNSPLSASFGGVALDGLKEGVRMITAGFSDLGGAIHDVDSNDQDASKPKPLTRTSRENNHASDFRAKRTGSEHLPTRSTSSTQERAHAPDHVHQDWERDMIAMAVTVATAPSLSRASSLNNRVYKRTSRVIAEEPTTPTSTCVAPPAQSPKPANLDAGMSVILTPSPTLVPPPLSAASASPTPTPKSPVLGSTHGPAHTTAGPMSSWMDNMGKKLSGLQKGQTFSKSQKRASSLLAGVSNTITSALQPGPTATTPALAPPSTLVTSRNLSMMIPPSASPASTKSSLTTSSRSPLQPQPQARPHPSCNTTMNGLDDEEQTIHAGGISSVSDPKRPPRASASVPTTDGAIEREGAPAVSSFDDDDWNW